MFYKMIKVHERKNEEIVRELDTHANIEYSHT